MASKNAIRVLIAEDSLAYRELITAILQTANDVEVVGAARNGAEAVRLVRRLEPDLVVMDIHMPEMNGLEATQKIMEEMPRPILMVSASVQKNEQQLTFEALKAGALSVLNKPTLYDPPEVYRNLVAQVMAMAEVRVVRRWANKKPLPGSPLPPLQVEARTEFKVLAIASSTGGPAALAVVLSQLPAHFPLPVVIVQHITKGFGQGLAEWLNQQTKLPVRLARHGDALKSGQILIAPDDYHLMVNHMNLIALSQSPPVHGLRPAADHLFHSVAERFKANAIGVILTGMGDDGAQGIQAMHQAGAYTIAQDEETCVVFGMPKAAIARGAISAIRALPQIPNAIIEVIRENEHAAH